MVAQTRERCIWLGQFVESTSHGSGRHAGVGVPASRRGRPWFKHADATLALNPGLIQRLVRVTVHPRKIGVRPFM